DKGLAESTAGQDLALLSWHPAEGKFLVVRRPAGEPPSAYVRMDRTTPVWQLLEGWQPRAGFFRWSGPSARAALTRPEGARRFELVVNAGPSYIQYVRRGEVDVLLNGQPIGHAEFTREGWQTVSFDLAPAPPGPVEVTFRARPEIRTGPDNKLVFGAPIGAFGFVTAPSGRGARS
ncbi:MAG: hypothetical protein HY822_08460, partial [Acidobacteria bacterium]|nr:hypothetical protein [Acidobacteriota bacterium]